MLVLGPYTGVETKAVSFRIDVRDLAALDSLAAEMGVNRGQILRSLVKSELRRVGRLPADDGFRR